MRPELLSHATNRLMLGHAPIEWLARSNRRWRDTARAYISPEKNLGHISSWGRRAQQLVGKLRRDLEVYQSERRQGITFDASAQQPALSRRSSESSISTLGSLASANDTFSDDEDPDADHSAAETASTVASTIGTTDPTRKYWRRALARNPAGKRLLHRHRGDVLFIRQFAVQVRVTRQEAKSVDKYEIPLSTVKDRLKEYTAVARWTGKPWAPVAIYLYASQEVSRKIDHRWSRARKHKILLTATTKATFFDTLDLSVALWESKSKQKEIRFFLFMGQSIKAQVAWLFYLLNMTGNMMAPLLQLKVPSADTTVELSAEWIAKVRETTQKPEELRDHVSYDELRSPYAYPSRFISEIYKLSAQLMANHATSSLRSSSKLFLGWRRVDFVRIFLWEDDVHAATASALLDHHNLELRQVHTLTTPQEPPAIEGFCWRLTTWRGQERRQKLVTRTYLHSHNHLLFHCNPRKALMPIITMDDGEDLLVQQDKRGNVDEAVREQLKRLPLVCDLSLYPLDDAGDIAWVKRCATNDELRLHDAKAVYAHARMSSNIEASDGCIDMSTITSVRPVNNPQMFEIRLEGNQNVLIRVQEAEVRDAWVMQLKRLAVYWRAQRTLQLKEAKRVYERNMQQNTNFILRSKLESNFTVPDMWSFPIETMTHTRPVIHAGYIYKKAHKHGFFYKFYGVLTNNSLILYHAEGSDYNVSQDRAHKDTHFVLNSVYDLLHTYVYSGSIAREYLLRENEDSFDFAQMYNGVPRIYDEDWIIQDREADCCFVLWSENRKSKGTARHGSIAARLVCMARSRVERDQWVNAFQSVTTRLATLRSGNNVQVQSGTAVEL